MSDVVLKLRGAEYNGWKEIHITRSIEQMAGTFELLLVDKWTLDGSAPQIRDGQACQVLIDGHAVITGWIDEVEATIDNGTHELRVTGRDKAGDLVDCSAIHASQEWVGRNLAQIAADAARPFGIGVRVETAVGAAFKYNHVDEGETVYELLERAARMRGVLVMSDADSGDIVITRAGSRRATTPLVYGDNVKAGTSLRSQRDRYSMYRVTGQQRETDFLEPEDAAAPSAQVRDPGIGRYRPIVIAADGAADTGDCGDRARWERSVRTARGQRGNLTVRGWLDTGRPWEPNVIVACQHPPLGLAGDYLIASVEYILTANEGATTRLSVVPPGAYDVLAEPETNPAGESDLFSFGDLS